MNAFSRREFLPLAGLTLLGTSCLSSVQGREKVSTDSSLIRPQALKEGDIIGICAPAGCVKDTSEVAEFISLLQSMGYQVKKGSHVTGRYGYFSATDEERAMDFNELIADEKVKAIFFVRGGWGSARILPLVDFEAIKANPKIIMGFSDITTLLNAITFKTGLVTFHGPGGNSSWNDFTLRSFRELLVEGKSVQYLRGGNDLPVKTLVKGTGKGELYGGNLSVLTSLIGTGYLPDWKGKILFLEDVSEEPYRIDRMLTQLKLAGVFETVQGIVLGQFRDCVAEEPERSFTLEEVFEQQLNDLPVPVLSGLPFGHVRDKYILPVGIGAELVTDQGLLKLDSAAVSG